MPDTPGIGSTGAPMPPDSPEPAASCDDVVAFDLDTMEQLRGLQARLHGGTDRERDMGHRLWLLLNRGVRCPAAELQPARPVTTLTGRRAPDLDEPVEFRLASGEAVQVTLSEGALGVPGYRLKITATRGVLAALPSAGNSMEVSTLAGLRQEQERIAEVVRERDAQRPPRPVGRERT